ncbi:hypothetical protein EBB07_29675 [Paenibacillaceae bacterium]|nr:hypothetical protein EBB07_29675 [Paenibacillaceae bacterium]
MLEVKVIMNEEIKETKVDLLHVDTEFTDEINAVVYKGRTYIELRASADAYGAEVTYDSENKRAKLILNKN